jgi:hypothetical protein
MTRTPKEGPSVDKLMARDIIYKIDDDLVINPAQVKRVIGSKKPNDVVNFTLIRDGKTEVVSVTLDDGWTKLQKPEDKAEDYAGLLGMAVEMWSDKKDERGQFKTPVITKIYGLGPAHLGYITSSQSIAGLRGSIMASVQVTVNTVTGVVIKGEYQPVEDLTTLKQFATQAYDNKLPLLLEIESWYRDPRYFYMPLEYNTTAFYKIQPAPSDTAAYELDVSPHLWQSDDFEREVSYSS